MELPTLTNVLIFFEDAFSAGRTGLFPDAQRLMHIFVVLEVAFAGLYLALGSSADIRAIAKKMLVIGFFFWFLTNYGDILRFVVDGFLYAGEKAGSGTTVNFATLRDPGQVFAHGMELAQPLAAKLFSDINSSYFGIPSVDGLMLLFCIILTVFSFAIMAIQVFITYLEYLLVATAGFILIPFGIFKPTAFIAERVFGAIISFGVKLMILALIIGVSDAFLSTVVMPPTVSWQQAVELSVIALALTFLSLHAPAVAQSLLSGTPHLSFGSIAATGAGTSFVATRAASAITPAAGATLAAAGALHGGGAAAAAAMGSVLDAGSVLGKTARVASKAAMYGVGGVGGVVSGGSLESAGKVIHGSGGLPNGSRNYRQQIQDPSLRSNARSSGRAGTGGIVGNFNAGRFSVPQYRAADERKRKTKSQEVDEANVSKAREEMKSSDPGQSSKENSEEKVQESV